MTSGTLRLGANNVLPNASNVSIGAVTFDAFAYLNVGSGGAPYTTWFGGTLLDDNATTTA